MSDLLCDPTPWGQRCIFTGWQWQRKLLGGCWEYWHFIGWQRSTPEKIAKLAKYRPGWAQENWGA